jgi:hypothetical protein
MLDAMLDHVLRQSWIRATDVKHAMITTGKFLA